MDESEGPSGEAPGTVFALPGGWRPADLMQAASNLQGIMPDRRRTSIAVYEEDAERLRALQRQLTARRNQYVTMFDLVHEIVGALENRGV